MLLCWWLLCPQEFAKVACALVDIHVHDNIVSFGPKHLFTQRLENLMHFTIYICKYERASCTEMLLLLCDCGNTWEIDLIEQFGRSLLNTMHACRSTVSTCCSLCGAPSGTMSTSKGGRSRWHKILKSNTRSVLLRTCPKSFLMNCF